MIASLGSLRRCKSTSSAASRRTTPAKHIAEPHIVLDTAGRRHAQVAASLAFERSKSADVPVEQRCHMRPRRGTVADTMSMHRTTLNGSTVVYVAPEHREYVHSDKHSAHRIESTHRKANSRTDENIQARDQHTGNPVITLSEAAQTASTMSLIAAQNPRLRRSHSMRRTLRDSDSSVTRSRRSILIPHEGVQQSQAPADVVKLRKSKSLYTWIPWPRNSSDIKTCTKFATSSEAQSSCEQARPVPDMVRSALIDSEALRAHSSTLGPQITEPNSRDNSRLRQRKSFITLPFQKRSTSSVTSTVSHQSPNRQDLYPTSGMPCKVIIDVRDSDVRTTSNSTTRRSRVPGTKLLRYFSRTSQSSEVRPDLDAVSCRQRVKNQPPSNVQISRKPSTDSHLLIATSVDPNSAELLCGHQSQVSISLADPFGIVATYHQRPSLSSPSTDPANVRLKCDDRASSPAITTESCTSHSRVTSWADSTIAASTDERLSVIAEDGQALAIERITSSPSLTSTNDAYLPANKKANDASNTLLRRFIRKPELGPASEELNVDESGKIKRSSLISSWSSWRHRQTIRSISDQSSGNGTRKKHAASPPTLPANCDFRTPSVFRRKPVPVRTSNESPPHQPVTPSAAVRAERTSKADNRWASPLVETQGLFFPRSPVSSSHTARKTRTSLGSGASPTIAINDHVRIGDPVVLGEQARDQVPSAMSPSIYSQPSGFDISPASLGRYVHGTATIVESKTYSAHSPVKTHGKIEQSVKSSSGDWTRWLHKEVADITNDASEISFEGFTESIITSTPMKHKRESAIIVEDTPSKAIRSDDQDMANIDAQDLLTSFGPNNWANGAHVVGLATKQEDLSSVNDGDSIPTTLCARSPSHTSTSESRLSQHSSVLDTPPNAREYHMEERQRRRARLAHQLQSTQRQRDRSHVDDLLGIPSKASSRSPSAKVGAKQVDPNGRAFKEQAAELVQFLNRNHIIPRPHVKQDDSMLDFLMTTCSEGLQSNLRPSPTKDGTGIVDTYTDRSGRQHVSKLPVPVLQPAFEQNSPQEKSHRRSTDKENVPRSSPTPSGNPSLSMHPRMSRSHTMTPVMSQDTKKSSLSPLRSSPLRAQTGGQLLAERWLNDKSLTESPTAGVGETSTSDITRMFL